jgi:hypothetical protein
VVSQDADRRLWMKTTNYGMGLVPIFYFRFSNGAAMDGRFVILAFKDERINK